MMCSLFSRAMSFAGVFVALTGVSHAQAGKCRDPWINQAYTAVMLRPPVGTGDSGECNKMLYGGGSWSSLNDLEKKIVAYHHPAPAAPTGSFSGITINLQNNTLVDHGNAIPLSSVQLVGPTGSLLTPQQAASIVAQGGGNIVAQGGGNIVAQGGGNIVAQGGGNFHTLSVGEKKVYRITK